MTDPVSIVAGLIWLALIAAWAAHQRWAGKAHQRHEAALCTRCGRQAVEAGAPGSGRDRATMCEECLRVTQRNYRAATWLCYSLAALFGIMAPIITISELRRFGTRTALLDAGLFIGMIVLTAGGGLAIRRFGGRVR